MPLDGEDFVRIKEVIVDPLCDKIDGMHEQMKSDRAATNQAIADLSTRIGKVEGNQRKAMLGYGGVVVAVTAAVNVTWNRIKEKLGWKNE